MKRFAIPAVASKAGIFLAVMAASSAVRAEPIHVRGSVSKVDGSSLTVTTNAGTTIGLTLDDNWKIAGVVPASMGDIKPGVFIGTANQKDASGNRALEVVVFPEAMRGTGEGDYGWDLKPKSSMTNATVENAVTGVDGQTITLKYKGGAKKVTVGGDTPIVTIAPATKDDLKPGAKVFISGEASSDGSMLTKGFIAVGKGGATPPM
jgi:hypothetical protein